MRSTGNAARTSSGQPALHELDHPSARSTAVPKARVPTKALMTLIRVNAWLAVLTIIVLSVVPGNWRPHVMANDYLEHFTAYFITGTLLAIGFSGPVQQLANCIMLATCAGLLEFVQLWVPGRTASMGEFITGALGAWLGIVAIFVVRRVLAASERVVSVKINLIATAASRMPSSQNHKSE